MGSGRDELLLLDNTGINHPADYGFSKFSCADYGDFCLCEHAVPFK
jgi:hypothetical protein